jgi:CelD/BcsL family acetyltransferase involved in cellulose biosynthesis
MRRSYEVQFAPLPDSGLVESLWCDLEARSHCVSFFNSWSWIGHWLAVLPARFERRLLEARCDGKVVGLGILVRNRRRLAGIPFCTTWHLHEAGEEAYDGVMVEHNDFLIDNQHGDALRAAMVECWAKATGGAQELHLPGLDGSGFSSAVSGPLKRSDNTRMSYAIGLQAVRDHNLDFTALVGSHGRRFIRRSLKEYQTLGEVRAHVAENADQALEYFDRMIALHNVRWQAEGLGGAFESNFNYQLHRRVIAAQTGNGEIQLLRVSVGNSDIGFLYSFIRGKRLYVYQSGFNYDLLEKHGRPGLVAHTQAVQYNAGLGFDVYDLMAGESQYKKTISTLHENLTWSVWQKPALRFFFEDQLRRVVRRVKKLKTAAATNDSDEGT